MAPIRRLGVLGDLHGERARLEIAINALEEVGVDAISQVGDIVDGDGIADAEVDHCIGLLREKGVLTIAGNHERWFLTSERRERSYATQMLNDGSMAFIQNLPTTLRIKTTAGDCLLCHGIGENDMAMLRSDTRGYALQSLMPDLLPLMRDEALAFAIGGHTHERMARRLEGLTFINAGTLARTDAAGFILVDFDARQVLCWNFEKSGTAFHAAETLSI